MDLSNRRKGGSVFASYDDSRTKRHEKSGVQVTSEMQGILTVKENNESKAANLVAEYLSSKAAKTYDEKLLMRNLDDLLNGFTTEEKLRIVSAALVRALCKIS